MSEMILLEEPENGAPYCMFVEALPGTQSRRYVFDTGGISTDNLKHMAECLVRELRSRQEPELNAEDFERMGRSLEEPAPEPEGPEFEDGPEFNGWEDRAGRFQWREQMWVDEHTQSSTGWAETENIPRVSNITIADIRGIRNGTI